MKNNFMATALGKTRARVKQVKDSSVVRAVKKHPLKSTVTAALIAASSISGYRHVTADARLARIVQAEYNAHGGHLNFALPLNQSARFLKVSVETRNMVNRIFEESRSSQKLRAKLDTLVPMNRRGHVTEYEMNRIFLNALGVGLQLTNTVAISNHFATLAKQQELLAKQIEKDIGGIIARSNKSSGARAYGTALRSVGWDTLGKQRVALDTANCLAKMYGAVGTNAAYLEVISETIRNKISVSERKLLIQALGEK